MNELENIIDDIQRVNIILVSEAGHGKTSSLRTIIKHLKEKRPETIVKIFDISLAWFHRAPVPHRQMITLRKMLNNDFRNIDNCVYEIGSLTEEARRYFVGLLIKQDYDRRYNLKTQHGEAIIDKLPKIVYILEEANCYFDSPSLNKKDIPGLALRDFVSAGRNFGLRAFCVVTAEIGELGTRLRRRSTHLIGKIISDSDQRFFNRKIKGLGNDALKIPPYHWVYYDGKASEPFRIRDEVETSPSDFIIPSQFDFQEAELEKGLSNKSKWVLVGMAVFIILFVLWAVYT